MDRRSLPSLLLLTVAGCGGAGSSTMTAMSPVDPTASRAGGVGAGAAEAVFKPAAGVNVPLGSLTALAPKSVLAKAPEGKVDKDGAAKLAKLGKEGMRLDDGYQSAKAAPTPPLSQIRGLLTGAYPAVGPIYA